MRLKSHTLSLVLFTAGLYSCTANVLRVTYSSEPQGAMISQVDSIATVGQAPVTRSYPLETLPEPDEQGCIVIPGVEAVWESGATARVGRLRICNLEDTSRFIELPRPNGFPDLDLDIEVAAALGRQRARDRDFRRIGGVEAPRSNPTGN